MLVAGEASGDLLGAALIEALQRLPFPVELTGIAGPKMQAAGCRSLFPMEALSVRGYVEALSALPRILRIRKNLLEHAVREKPDLFIGIDAPDFNLGVETHLKAAGIKTVHFVSPSVWAWRRKRLQKMPAAVAHTLLIFPLEVALYANAGLSATYVGHPLARSLPLRNPGRARERLGLEPQGRYCALLPGSRQGELRHHAALFIATARQLHAQHPDLTFLVPLVTRETWTQFEAALSAADAWTLPIRLLFGHGQDALEAADIALIKSGTATLEAALLACPHVITYRVPRFTAWLMRRKAYLPWVGLPNILANRELVPELIQENATAEKLAAALTQLLTDRPAYAAQQAGLTALRADLTRDTPALIAAALAPMLSPTPV